MIEEWKYSSGVNYIAITWNSPKYEPAMYELYYTCGLHGENHSYISSRLENLNSYSTTARVSGLLPESVCLLRLLAVYNPASIDPGLIITVETLRAEKPMCKCFLVLN